MNNQSLPSKPPFWRSRAGMAFLLFVGVAGFLLFYEHRAHIPGSYWLLGGLLAACVLMHGFMHSGHGGDHGHNSKPDERMK